MVVIAKMLWPFKIEEHACKISIYKWRQLYRFHLCILNIYINICIAFNSIGFWFIRNNDWFGLISIQQNNRHTIFEHWIVYGRVSWTDESHSKLKFNVIIKSIHACSYLNNWNELNKICEHNWVRNGKKSD